MKKLFYLLLICFCIISCKYADTKPIEKYQGKDYILIDEPIPWSNVSTELILKSKDSIFRVYVHPFDVKNLKVGDTLK